MNIKESADEKGAKYHEIGVRRALSRNRARKRKAEAKAKKKSDLRKTAAMRRADFYLSDAWTSLRYQALKLYGGACQCCGATRKDGIKLHVDHIKPRSKYPALALELGNLQVLCEPCNLGKRNTDETDWR